MNRRILAFILLSTIIGISASSIAWGQSTGHSIPTLVGLIQSELQTTATVVDHANNGLMYSIFGAGFGIALGAVIGGGATFAYYRTKL